jgi:hypothetical protein
MTLTTTTMVPVAATTVDFAIDFDASGAARLTVDAVTEFYQLPTVTVLTMPPRSMHLSTTLIRCCCVTQSSTRRCRSTRNGLTLRSPFLNATYSE